MKGVVRATFGVCVLAMAVHPAGAQEKPGPVAEVSAGWVGFADDSVVSEGLVGGNVRFYLSPRIAVGPEVVYIAGQNHSHMVATGNLTFDALAPIGGKPRRVTPFFVAGGGLFPARERSRPVAACGSPTATAPPSGWTPASAGSCTSASTASSACGSGEPRRAGPAIPRSSRRREVARPPSQTTSARPPRGASRRAAGGSRSPGPVLHGPPTPGL
jgi:hypothetical protein